MAFITFDESERLFRLRTDHTEYQIKLDAQNALQHLYYGKEIKGSAVISPVIRSDIGFSGNLEELGNDRTYSFDVIPQEYSGFGNGDFRTTAFEAVNGDGSRITDFRYRSHKIQEGKYCLPGLPSVYAKEDEAETLEIHMADEYSGLEAILYYAVLPKEDIITRAVRVENHGSRSAMLEKVLSAQLELPTADYDMIHFYGRHASERKTERTALHHGIQSVGSLRGMSSHHHNPFLIFCSRKAEEDYGECYGMSLVYSGNFLAEAEVDQLDQTRVVMGIHPEQFTWKLNPGDSFTAPEVVLSYSAEGLGRLSRNYHRAYRQHLCRGKYKTSRRPILINNWEATYFNFTEEKLFQIAKEAKEIGVEMLVMDDGWFGKRDDDVSGLGDWVVNTEKLKGGLKPLVDRIHGLGLKFGIWIEPEMISEDSDLYRAHPDWCLKAPGRPANRSRYQLNLDISRKEVREAVLNSLFAVFDSCDIQYVKWDMNRAVTNVYSAGLPEDQQGEVMHRYVLGLYDMLERFTSRYPDILLESCAGGGGRFDAGMLYYSPQIWCSDNTDAIERLKIQYGTSFGYPISAAGSHVSACPNHQTGRTTPFETRGVVAMAGTFGYELDLEKISEAEKEAAREQVETYKRMAPFVLTGDYYRLTNPYEEPDYVMWQFVSENREEAVLSGVFIQAEPMKERVIVKLGGLQEDAWYRIEGIEGKYTGAALMYSGIVIKRPAGDYQAVMYFISQAEKE